MSDLKVYYQKLSGELTAPASKSHTLRAILFASLAIGTSYIRNYLPSPDADAMMAACKQLGAEINATETVLTITGVAGQPKQPDNIIDAGNSGQVLRFIAGICALINGYTVITGDNSIRHNRPVKPLMTGLTGLGATCVSMREDDHAPIIIKGPIQASETSLTGEDSQPVSALLIASAFLKGTSIINVTHPGELPWIGVTLAWFDKLGIQYKNKNFTRYEVEGGNSIAAFDYTVPGDFSSMAYPIAAALITQSEIKIHPVDMQDAQGDKKLIHILQSMGADIVADNNTLYVKPSAPLQGCEIDVNDFIDALPILAVIACYAQGTTTLYNAGIARQKESDRLSAITTELKKMGANITESETSLTIIGKPLHAAIVDSHHDHRIAMSLIVAACGINENSTIRKTQCIAKSYPGFVKAMQALGLGLSEAV